MLGSLTTTAMFSNYPTRRTQVPHIRIDSPSDPARLDADPVPYSMYPSQFMSSTLLSQDGYDFSNPQSSPLEELVNDDLIFSELDMSLFSDCDFLTGPFETPAVERYSFVPSSPSPMVPHNTSANSPYTTPVFTPSPSSSCGSLSPSPVGHELPQSPWSLNSPSSDGCVSPIIPSLGLSRRESSASLRHHHSPSDPMFGHTLRPPATPRHIRSHSESSMTRPVASQAMIEANQRRRRHEATYRCEECGQTFTAIFSLKRHAQSHTGVRPFACRIPGCGQAFFNQSDCRRHEKSKKRHRGLPYTLPGSP